MPFIMGQQNGTLQALFLLGRPTHLQMVNYGIHLLLNDRVCCRLLKLRRAAPVLLGKVTRQIAAVMKNPQDVNNGSLVMAATIDYEVPGIAHNARRGFGATAAEAQVVDQDAFGKAGTPLNAGAFGIVPDIGQSLGHQRIVAKGRRLTEFLQAPLHYGDHVTPRGAGDVNFIFRVSSHAYFRPRVRLLLPSAAGA
jgi:hypothetical protein